VSDPIAHKGYGFARILVLDWLQ